MVEDPIGNNMPIPHQTISVIPNSIDLYGPNPNLIEWAVLIPDRVAIASLPGMKLAKIIRHFDGVIW